eukprot:scaffold94231_cov48-Phaeocystis_antarctica.AAC.5
MDILQVERSQRHARGRGRGGGALARPEEPLIHHADCRGRRIAQQRVKIEAEPEVDPVSRRLAFGTPCRRRCLAAFRPAIPRTRQALAAPILSPLHDENLTSDQCEWARHDNCKPSPFGCHRSL